MRVHSYSLLLFGQKENNQHKKVLTLCLIQYKYLMYKVMGIEIGRVKVMPMTCEGGFGWISVKHP